MQFALCYLIGILFTIEFLFLAYCYLNKLEPNEYKSKNWISIIFLSLWFPITFISFALSVLVPLLITSINKLFK